MTTYLSCADTAKLLRQGLKESFPGIKFSVKSSVYSGGASIRVRWTDGPMGTMVKAITDKLEGGYFDGMIDYKGTRYHLLDGAPVHFGADFIFEEHSLSKPRAESIVAHFAQKWGRSDWVELEGCDYFGYRAAVPPSAPAVYSQVSEYEEQTCGIVRQPSPTLARIQFAGDDGYGAGTVGRPGSTDGGEQCYKAQEAARERARLVAI